MKEEKVLIESAIALAESWQNKANDFVTDFERKFYVKMNKMLEHPKDKVLLLELMDQCFRSKSTKRVANQLDYLLKKHGIASFFTTSDRALLWLFQNAGKYFPAISVPLVINYIRDDTKTVVLKGEKKALGKHLAKRKSEGDAVILNMIGEVVLGEDEAEKRMRGYLNAIEDPDISSISIKISTIYSQINTLALKETIDVLVEKLSRLYAHAQKHQYVRADGKKQDKFINLDMEEYRDLEITVDMFKQTLDKPEFKNVYTGIVLQAYLPDAYIWQKDLTDWAKKRVEAGGSPIKVRLVKGANMEMEETEASQKHWEMVTYTDKTDTDANYKKMVTYGLDSENAPYVRIGTGSHNLFELAYATVLAEKNGTSKYHTIEMLEGMSEPARLAINDISKKVLLYGPAAKKEQFTNAIAYLVRRLDENTGDDNFIRYSFGLKVGSDAWVRQKELFVESFEREKSIFLGVKRTQNRLSENWDNFAESSYDTGEFKNEADTDFVLPHNQEWAKCIVKKWKFSKDTEHNIVPVVVGGEELTEGRKVKEAADKSQLKEGVLAGRVAIANADDIKKAVETAKNDVDGWRSLSNRQRHAFLKKAAINMRKKRADLIGIVAAEVGKVFTETDVEVSEAIDFIEFYPHAVKRFEDDSNLKFEGLGVGVVVPPWNFPIAIPVGGLAATLAAGNTVIIKPASVAALSAYELCKCFWDAGISKNTLQYLPCPGSLAGKHLIASNDVSFVILTGGESTAYSMLETRPELFLTAETGGKDATIVTKISDREQAIKNVCHSAFSNSGQKCSATSLLILEDEVYDDESFKKGLVDAAKSMSVGSVWNLKNKIGTLANEVSGDLKHGVETLEDGEEWALPPTYAEDNPYMLRPAIKWGVKNASFCHMTELFGPVLSVMRASSLKEAVAIVNATGYGLTSGLESLDQREIDFWKANLKAGNLYINRGTTGAIVLRQPFGGMGKSAIGAGRKAGIFNYITQFVKVEERDKPKVEKSYSSGLSSFLKRCKTDADGREVFEKLEAALQSYLFNYEAEFSPETDYCKVRGEDNHFRYIPLNKVAIRVSAGDSLFDIVARVLAARVAKVAFTVSIIADSPIRTFLEEHSTDLFTVSDALVVQNDDEFIKTLSDFDRIIYSNPAKVPQPVFEAAAAIVKFIVRQPPLMEGRMELLNYFIEQSISNSYHRYGNIGARAFD